MGLAFPGRLCTGAHAAHPYVPLHASGAAGSAVVVGRAVGDVRGVRRTRWRRASSAGPVHRVQGCEGGAAVPQGPSDPRERPGVVLSGTALSGAAEKQVAVTTCAGVTGDVVTLHRSESGIEYAPALGDGAGLLSQLFPLCRQRPGAGAQFTVPGAPGLK